MDLPPPSSSFKFSSVSIPPTSLVPKQTTRAPKELSEKEKERLRRREQTQTGNRPFAPSQVSSLTTTEATPSPPKILENYSSVVSNTAHPQEDALLTQPADSAHLPRVPPSPPSPAPLASSGRTSRSASISLPPSIYSITPSQNARRLSQSGSLPPLPTDPKRSPIFFPMPIEAHMQSSASILSQISSTSQSMTIQSQGTQLSAAFLSHNPSELNSLESEQKNETLSKNLVDTVEESTRADDNFIQEIPSIHQSMSDRRARPLPNLPDTVSSSITPPALPVPSRLPTHSYLPPTLIAMAAQKISNSPSLSAENASFRQQLPYSTEAPKSSNIVAVSPTLKQQLPDSILELTSLVVAHAHKLSSAVDVLNESDPGPSDQAIEGARISKEVLELVTQTTFKYLKYLFRFHIK